MKSNKETFIHLRKASGEKLDEMTFSLESLIASLEKHKAKIQFEKNKPHKGNYGKLSTHSVSGPVIIFPLPDLSPKLVPSFRHRLRLLLPPKESMNYVRRTKSFLPRGARKLPIPRPKVPTFDQRGRKVTNRTRCHEI